MPTLSTRAFAPETTSVPGSYARLVSERVLFRGQGHAYGDSSHGGNDRREDEEDEVLLELHIDCELKMAGSLEGLRVLVRL